MRTILKIALRGCLVLLGVAAVLYIADDLWARLQGRPVQQMKVDRIFAELNHYDQVEYSIGTPIMVTCVDALMPHFGDSPCWYVQRHLIQKIGP